MTDNRKTTVPGASVGADAVQSSDKITTNIITNSGKQINLQAAKKSNNFGLNTVSMTELYDTVYPPRRPIVNDLLYSGTYLFVGAPKVGKSFFMGQLAYHVAMGLPLWEYEVHQGTVLYLALEDDYARLQRRLSRMFGVEETNNLYFATQAKSVSEGLDQQLEGFIREHPDVRLIIIDTLQKVREIGGDRYSYASDYEIVTKLKTFSDRYGICLLVVHHTRKMEAEDSFDMISGTNGLLGAANPRPQTKAPGKAQRHLLMDGTSVKSAFALLSTKVTKPLPCPAPVPSTEKGRAIEKNHFRNAGSRLPQP